MKNGECYSPYMIFQGCITPNCIMKRRDLTATAKLCFGRLAQFAGHKGFCFPSQKTLADELGTSESVVKAALASLIESKLILVEKPAGTKKVMHFNNMYKFIWNDDFLETSKTSSTKSRKSAVGPAENHPPLKENHEKENHIIISEKKNSAKRFIKPTIEELEEYCKERGNSIDPQYFLDYQEARGWLFKNGAAIKDWRAVIRTWERNIRDRNQQQNQPQDTEPEYMILAKQRMRQQLLQERSDEF